MILTGHEIRRRRVRGEIEITPYNSRDVNQASYDVRLGSGYCVYTKHSLDARKPNPVRHGKIGDSGILVRPGKLYLMHTSEVIYCRRLVPKLEGKSSIGRLGIVVHVTAGHVEPGFRGQITLEVVALGLPVRLYAGMRIGQLVFHTTRGKSEDYTKRGNYVGKLAQGAVPSMSWKQFAQDQLS